MKRLSSERQIAPSSQKKEIKEEIVTIKRQSLIEDTRAIHEDEILMQKPVDNTYKSTVVPETIVKLKTTTLDSSSVDKADFDKELQDKFHKTLGDVDKFEHHFTQEEPVTETIVVETTKVTSGNDFDDLMFDMPEKIVTTTKTTTTYSEVKSSDPYTNGKSYQEVIEQPIVTKRTEINTSTYTDEDGYVHESRTVYEDEDLSDQEFQKLEKEVLDPSVVNEILEEARSEADRIQGKISSMTSKIPTSIKNGKEKITSTTTTVRTIESINLDDVHEDRSYDDDEESLVRTKVFDSG